MKRSGIVTILFLLAVSLTAGCSATIKKPQNTDFDEWVDHPETVLSLSSAIVEGMRHLMNEILISEMWFEDMDISITSADAEILTAKIRHFKIHPRPSSYLFSQWRIFRASRVDLEYTNTLYFNNFARSGNAIVPASMFSPDSLFIDIYESSSRFYLQNHKELSGIKIIFWRDKSRHDIVATVRMDKSEDKRFTVKYPVLP